MQNTDYLPKKYDTGQNSGDDSAFYSLCATHTTSNGSDESDYSTNELDSDDNETQEISIESLQLNYTYLLDQMETDGVLDILHESRLFDDAFFEMCKETPNRRRRVDLIIKEIDSIAKAKSNSVLDHFAVALAIDQPFILDKLKEKSSKEIAMGYAHKHKKFITLMRSRIIRDVEPRKFMHMLVTNKTLSLKDHEDIMRLMHRKDQVKELLAIANEGNSRSAKVIHAIIEASPKLYKEYKLKAQRGSCQSLSPSVGAAIEIKMNVRSKNMSDTNQQFTMIEKQVVDTYNSVEQENHDDMLNDMVEECRCKFEGLKISSIVIQLLTLDDDSKEKILSKVRNGKLVEWFISMLDENNLNALRQFGNVQLEIIISEDIGGNFNSLISLKDCLCKVDRKFVVENKKRLKEIIADETFLNQLLEQIGLTTSNKTLQNEKGITDKKLSIRVLDLLEDGTAPRIAYCLIEEHIKLKVPSAVGLLTKSGNGNTQTVPSKSDIDLHIEYLTEELEIQSFTPILSTLKTKSSMMLLDELEKCPCRRTRIVKFLEFLKLQEDITWFWTEVKKKQHYIFDTIASSTSHSKLKEDLLAVKLMNDTIIEEVDPTLLWQYMDEKSAEKLGKIEFRNITSRKRQAQYILNRLSLANIYEFMKTLRRCGYENLYSEIDAGSLSERYVCPRLHERHGKGKRIFKGQFDIDTRCKEMVDTSRSLSDRYVCPRLHELHGKGKRIFRGQFDIDTRCKEIVDTSRSLSERYVCPRLHERHGKGKRIFKSQFDIDTRCKEMVDTSSYVDLLPSEQRYIFESSDDMCRVGDITGTKEELNSNLPCSLLTEDLAYQSGRMQRSQSTSFIRSPLVGLDEVDQTTRQNIVPNTRRARVRMRPLYMKKANEEEECN